MEWFYVKEGERAGPFDDTAFAAVVAAGEVKADTLVWYPGLDNWKPYAEILAASPSTQAAPAAVEPAAATLASDAAPVASAACAVCGGTFVLHDLAQFGDRHVCAACKPRYVQSLKEGTTGSLVATYAGFWVRFGAIFLDRILIGVINMILQTAVTFGLRGGGGNDASAIGAMALVWLLQFGVSASYETYMVGRYGATLGKMAAKIRVVRADGSPLGYGRAFGRFCGKIVSSIIAGIGFIIAAFDDEKRALHDHMCGTRVIKVS